MTQPEQSTYCFLEIGNGHRTHGHRLDLPGLESGPSVEPFGRFARPGFELSSSAGSSWETGRPGGRRQLWQL